MSFEKTHAKIQARIWQAIAQGDIDLTDVPKEKVDALVTLVTSAALQEVNTELDHSAPEGATPAAKDLIDVEEEILWEGRPFLTIATRYIITNERLRVIEGLLGKDRIEIELVRIQKIDQKQTVRERLMGVGDIIVHSHDRAMPVLILNNITDPVGVHEILRRAILASRHKYGLSYREEM